MLECNISQAVVSELAQWSESTTCICVAAVLLPAFAPLLRAPLEKLICRLGNVFAICRIGRVLWKQGDAMPEAIGEI